MLRIGFSCVRSGAAATRGPASRQHRTLVSSATLTAMPAHVKPAQPAEPPTSAEIFSHFQQRLEAERKLALLGGGVYSLNNPLTKAASSESCFILNCAGLMQAWIGLLNNTKREN